MNLLARLRRKATELAPQSPAEDPAAWFRLISTDPEARAEVLAAVRSAVPPGPPT